MKNEDLLASRDSFDPKVVLSQTVFDQTTFLIIDNVFDSGIVSMPIDYHCAITALSQKQSAVKPNIRAI